MKKTLLICGALLVFAAPAFAAGYINMQWTDCPLGASAVNMNNTCSLNTGSVGTLVTSFQPPVDLPQFLGCAGTIDLQTNVAPINPWWHLETGGCRAAKISVSFDFTSGPSACIDFWAGQAAGGYQYSIPSPTVAVPSARLLTIQAVPAAGIGPITVLDVTGNPNEYYAFKVTFSKALSTGTGSCAGCLDKACFVFNSLSLSQPAPVPDVVLNSGPEQFTTYNGGTGQAICPSAVPTQKTTWGSVKALYR